MGAPQSKADRFSCVYFYSSFSSTLFASEHLVPASLSSCPPMVKTQMFRSATHIKLHVLLPAPPVCHCCIFLLVVDHFIGSLAEASCPPRAGGPCPPGDVTAQSAPCRMIYNPVEYLFSSRKHFLRRCLPASRAGGVVLCFPHSSSKECQAFRGKKAHLTNPAAICPVVVGDHGWEYICAGSSPPLCPEYYAASSIYSGFATWNTIVAVLPPPSVPISSSLISCPCLP